MTQRIVLSVTALALLAAACGSGTGSGLTTPGAGADPARDTTAADLAAMTTAPASTSAPTTRPPVGPAVLELVSAAPSEPGQQFDVRYGPPNGADYVVDGRDQGFILSRDGKKLFWLYDVTHSSSPHNNPYQHMDSGGSGGSNLITFGPGTVSLMLPEGLGPGTYELCADSLGDKPDPCLTITIDK